MRHAPLHHPLSCFAAIGGALRRSLVDLEFPAVVQFQQPRYQMRRRVIVEIRREIADPRVSRRSPPHSAQGARRNPRLTLSSA